jgi:hypothetical protein
VIENKQDMQINQFARVVTNNGFWAHSAPNTRFEHQNPPLIGTPLGNYNGK